MSAPDRIWVGEYEGEDLSKFVTFPAYTSRHGDGLDIEYLRATPELLALIEAAKMAGRPVETGVTGRAIADAALAFAKSQDHPDAG